MKIHARPESLDLLANRGRRPTAATRAAASPCGVTSTQRIHRGGRRRRPSRRRRRAAAVAPARERRRGASSRARAQLAELLAALGEQRRARSASRSSAAASSSSAAAKPSRSAAAPLRELARRVAEREAQLADRRADAGGGVGQLGDLARAGARGDLGVARELGELPRRDLLAEEERRGVGQLVRLVEDHRVARGQELGQPFVAQHHVGEEQVMVDDDDVGLERRLARLQHEAVAVERAVAPRQLSRVDVTSGQIDAFSGTSASSPRSPVVAGARERDDLRQVARVLARGQAALGGGALEVVVADVVGAALEQRERHRQRQRVAHERQVALEELVLQRLGAGRDDDLAAVEQRRERGRRRSCRCRCRPRRSAARARRSRARRPAAIASCCGRKRKPGSARASAPPSPKIAASSARTPIGRGGSSPRRRRR